MLNADVVADRFHVIKQVNSELNSMKKALKREAETINNSDKKEQMLAGIKKSKYALLKNEKDLNEQQKEKLDSIKQVAPLSGGDNQLKSSAELVFYPLEFCPNFGLLTGLLRSH